MSGRKFSSFNLKTLELSWIALDYGFLRCSGLPMLTTLKMTSCLLVLDRHQKEGLVDLFSNFPCLANLVVSNCFLPDRKTVGRMRISGPQLLSLELDKTEQFQIEIFAPKLQFFSVCQDVNNAQGFIELSLPTLDRADIALTQKQNIHLNKKSPYEHHYLKSLFPGLHNAKSLKLDSSIVQFLKKDLYPQLTPSMGFETVFAPLNDGHFINPIFQPQGYTILKSCTSTVQESYLDQEPSPFKRLETLIVSSYGLPFVESLFHDLYSGKPSKMSRYTVKALPLENGWEFEDPRANYLTTRTRMYVYWMGNQ
ncbi:unnamed protein product [Linum tenue]|uniref:Uncharacterized protein n=1 Tax=Linum tenue TaxID=586396 RepID=A0AAV0JUB7_9ROSI|nr:unnamed protein product [Linum tenue]